jgi:hypothetical protein
MSEIQKNKPTDVLRTRRLEVVDDEGRVRAVLGTNEWGFTSLSIFDQSERLRTSLDASEVDEQMNGLSVVDANGRLQISIGAHAISKKGCGFYCNDPNDENRGGFGMYEDGSAVLSISAAGKDRHIKMAATSTRDLFLVLSDEGAPMVATRLTESKEPLSPALALIDKDERAGMVISGGSDPNLRLVDRRCKVRGFFGLGVRGEPKLYVADEEGKPIVRQSVFDRVVADRGIVYQALLYSAVLFAGALGGAWIADAASASFYSLPAAIITTIVLIALIGWLVAFRRSW